MANPREAHAEPPSPARIHLGGPAEGEEALPRESAEISDGPVGQDAARVATVAAAVEEAPRAVLGQDDAGVSDTPSTRRFPRSRAQGAPALNVLPNSYNARKTYTRNDHGSSPFKNPTHASDSIVLSSIWTTVQGPPSSKKNSKRRATRAP